MRERERSKRGKEVRNSLCTCRSRVAQGKIGRSSKNGIHRLLLIT